MKRVLESNALLLWMFGLFLTFIICESVAGHHVYNDEQQQFHRPPIGYLEYLHNGHFLEAAAENWESEYLEMGMFVLLTAFFLQRGAAESKPPPEKEQQKEGGGESEARPESPWPVRRGGLLRTLYEYSLSSALLALFVVCFLLHAHWGAQAYNHEQTIQGQPTHLSLWQYIGTSQFWFQSFQNWQSEFLGVASLTLLSIYLRQRGSPESKRPEAPAAETGAQ